MIKLNDDIDDLTLLKQAISYIRCFDPSHRALPLEIEQVGVQNHDKDNNND